MGFREWCKQVLANLVGTWLGSGGLGAVTGVGIAYWSSPPAWAWPLYIVGGMLVFLLILDLHKRQETKQNIVSKQGLKSKEKPKEEIQDSIPYTFPAEHKEIREKILLVLKDDFPPVLTTLVAVHLSIDKTLAHYHLEELLDAKMVECFAPGIMNDPWENTWCISQRGRAYLVSHGLLK